MSIYRTVSDSTQRMLTATIEAAQRARFAVGRVLNTVPRAPYPVLHAVLPAPFHTQLRDGRQATITVQERWWHGDVEIVTACGDASVSRRVSFLATIADREFLIRVIVECLCDLQKLLDEPNNERKPESC